MINYNTSPKRKVVAKVVAPIKYLPKGARVLMMGATEGLCIRQAHRLNKGIEIYNCDWDEKVINKLIKKNLPIHSHYVGPVGGALRDIGHKFEFAFLDYTGFACSSIEDDLTFLNLNKKSKHVAITLCANRRFRGIGTWVNQAKKKFGNDAQKDPTMKWILHIMGNYEMIEVINYRREQGSMPMRVFTFKLKRVNKNKT